MTPPAPPPRRGCLDGDATTTARGSAPDSHHPRHRTNPSCACPHRGARLANAGCGGAAPPEACMITAWPQPMRRTGVMAGTAPMRRAAAWHHRTHAPDDQAPRLDEVVAKLGRSWFSRPVRPNKSLRETDSFSGRFFEARVFGGSATISRWSPYGLPRARGDRPVDDRVRSTERMSSSGTLVAD